MARSDIGEFMPFEIDRFFSSPRVQQMKDFQKWWYVSLLLRAWQAERPCHLPDDENELMILAGATSESSWKSHSALVLGAFQATGDGYRVNRRQLEIYEEKIGIREKNRINGKLGGRPRKTELKPNGYRMVSDTSSSNSDLEVVVVSEKSKFIAPRFELSEFDQDFDGELEFKRLCKVHPQPEDGIDTQRKWQQTIEREMESTGESRRKVADRMHECAIVYRNCRRSFTYGLGSWMTKGIWKQGIEIWEGVGNAGKQTASDRFRAALRSADVAHGQQLEKP